LELLCVGVCQQAVLKDAQLCRRAGSGW